MVVSLISEKCFPDRKISVSWLGRNYADSRVAHDEDDVVNLTESAPVSFRNHAYDNEQLCHYVCRT